MINDQAGASCPRTEDISAFLDGELDGGAARGLRLHVAQCSVCQPVLQAFSGLRPPLQALRDVHSDVDIAALVLPRLPPAPHAPARRGRDWRGLLQLGPRAAGGAAALGLGAWLGLALVTGGGASLRPAASASMSVFYGEPPGAYCAGLPACSARGR